MANNKDSYSDKISKEIFGLFSNAQKKDPNLKSFIDNFFKMLKPADSRYLKGDKLKHIVSASYNNFLNRRFGKPQISIYTPEIDLEVIEGDINIIEIIDDDMPFKFETIMGALNTLGYKAHFVVHPQFSVLRDSKGELIEIITEDEVFDKIPVVESVIHIHITKLTNEEQAYLKVNLTKVMEDNRIVVFDWQDMLNKVKKSIDHLQQNPPPISHVELRETISFLNWLVEDNFVLLGIREFSFDGNDLQIIENSGLGILRNADVKVLKRGNQLVSMTPEVLEFLRQPIPLIISKANIKATVHRQTHMDYIGLKQFDQDGNVIGELRIIGLFTSQAYNRSTEFIPILRSKLDHVLKMSRLRKGSYSERSMVNILNTFPRDELFQIDIESLYNIATGILYLYERPHTKIFIRKDRFDRFVSIMVYVLKEHLNTEVIDNIGELLATTLNGRVSAYYPAYPEGPLSRVHYIIGSNAEEFTIPLEEDIENNIEDIIRSWNDNFRSLLLSSGNSDYIQKYSNSFSKAYQDNFSIDEALEDILLVEKINNFQDISIKFLDIDKDNPSEIQLKLFSSNKPIALSDRLPILDHMGFRSIKEQTFKIKPQDKKSQDEKIIIWYHNISISSHDFSPIDIDNLNELLEETFLNVWYDKLENDSHNHLTLKEALNWRQISFLRAATKYLKQSNLGYEQQTIRNALLSNSELTLKLVEMFETKFDPSLKLNIEERLQKIENIKKIIKIALNQVSSLEDDTVINSVSSFIEAIKRTNFYQLDKNKNTKDTLSFKVNSSILPFIPNPKPHAEIFVYSPRVEAVHLRGGKIARGGIRWSDRGEDFRTEVLGLAKAQQVKNAVIVPVGAKGGFYPKQLPLGGDRETIQQEAITCYKNVIGSFLDITDNLVGDKIVKPSNVIEYDELDPYFVVAADKGTATFSDIANEISVNRNFWLDDAFASGGSAGYDHKAMGITAKGAWEAVKRHFFELGKNIMAEPFTVVGVGDMSGDVFGNGMLLSKYICLIGAFDHRDIFIDPNPDPASSFKERQRIFELPRSSWNDYNKDLISKGGGIFSRTAKSIKLSKEIKKVLEISKDNITPNELIQHILKSQAELMWFGGIGTYVRSKLESNLDVGDKATDAIRITASDLRVKVIGEGANLGLTQPARIEFAKLKGKINTDAVDNSAGVNSSDVEVNIKIALKAAEANGKLDRKARNKLLVEMTDEVAQLVLDNNYKQNLCLSIEKKLGIDELGYQSAMMIKMEDENILDREIEDLPSRMKIRKMLMDSKSLRRPELSVLMAYAKISIFNKILESDLLNKDYFHEDLIDYFPKKMKTKFYDEICNHKLRNEIISTILSNEIVNRTGISFAYRVQDESGAKMDEIVVAFILAYDSFDLGKFYEKIDSLFLNSNSSNQLKLYMKLQKLIRRMTTWFLRNLNSNMDYQQMVDSYNKGLNDLLKVLPNCLFDNQKEELQKSEEELNKLGFDKTTSNLFASLPYISNTPDIITIMEKTNCNLELACKTYFKIDNIFNIYGLIKRAESIKISEHFDRVAINRIIDDAYRVRRRLTEDVLSFTKASEKSLEKWQIENETSINRAQRKLSEILNQEYPSISALSVANGYLRDLLR